jgi:VCBS repeat-containing protein
VAAPDIYSVGEDNSLTAAGSTLLQAEFDAGAVLPFAPTWKVLSGLTNGNGGTPVLNYPTDGGGRNWKATDFDFATSSPGGAWVDTPQPMVGPAGNAIDYFASAGLTPVLLGGANVTTHLLRGTLTLDAEEASRASWRVRYLVDDGCIVHINGVEAFTLNMSGGGGVTASTPAPATGNESTLTEVTINLAGRLVPGVNTIAVEIHQTATGSGDAGFFMEWWPEAHPEGFAYTDDAFGTNRPAQASGSNSASDGNGGGGIRVRAEGSSMNGSQPISGAWTRSFNVPQAADYRVRVSHRSVASGTFEADEYQATLLEINGVRYGTAYAAVGTSVPAMTALWRTHGESATVPKDSGWQNFEQTIALPAGTNTFRLGLYLNRANAGNEIADAHFDAVRVSSADGGSGGPSVLANDSGQGAMTGERLSDPAHGHLDFQPDGSFVYTPNPDFSGIDHFTYRAVDGTGTSTPATVTLQVLPTNDPPTAHPDVYATDEDIALIVPAPGLLANDPDPDGDALTAVLRAPPPNGTVSLSANGGFTYTPHAHFHGTDAFTYRVNDGEFNSPDQTVTITVHPVNDAPTPVADAYQTVFNTPLVVTNATTVGLTPLPVTLVRAGQPVPLGSPLEAELPLWKYLDDGSDQGTAWRALAFDDSDWAAGAAELGYGDAPDGRPERTVVSFGPNPSAKYVTTYFRHHFVFESPGVVTNPTFRLIRDDAAAVYLNGAEIYRDKSSNGFPHLPADPAYNQFAGANISNADEAALRDLTAFLNPQPLAHLVQGENVIAAEVHQPNLFSSDLSFDLELSAQLLPYAGLLANDGDPEGDTLFAGLATAPTQGVVFIELDGTFSYFPNADFLGIDSFQYLASDGIRAATNTVTIQVVSGANTAPVAEADHYPGLQEDTPWEVSAPGPLGNDSDPDGDALSVLLVTPPAHGGLDIAPNGGFVYTPNPDFHGADSFQYRARDVRGKESPTTAVTLLVQPVNDPPAAHPDLYGLEPGETLEVVPGLGVLANDLDVDNPILSAVLVSPPAQGSLVLASDGSFTFHPPPGLSGDITFTYRAEDGALASPPATVTLRINGRPTALPDAFAGGEDIPLVVPAAQGLLANDSDPEAQTLQAVLVTPPAWGELNLAVDGSFTFGPPLHFHGEIPFAYQAFDGIRYSLPASVTLTFSARNDPPLARPDSALVSTGQVHLVSAPGVLGNDEDPDGESLTAELVETTAHGTLHFFLDGSWSYTPYPGFVGVDTFRYRARDAESHSGSASVTLQVSDPGDHLTLSEIFYRPGGGFPENTALEFIELHNRGSEPVDLTGWTISRGVSYAFPAGLVVPPGGYWVVAAHPTSFSAAYPGVTNVVGGWTGTLSNGGETLTLSDPSGRERDWVRYGNEGDWAVRARETTFGGWNWTTLADGGGRSLELIQPRLDNDCGQNWAVSPTIGGSPGRANDAAAPDVAPLIREVIHSPAVPLPTQPVRISCRLEDEGDPSSLSATVYWRNATTTTPGPFSPLPMSTDGQGVWFAGLPALPHLTIVEFYVQASDGESSRTWPAPTAEEPDGQVANCQYLVANLTPHPTAERLHLVLTAAENQAYAGVANSSDRRFNHTLIRTRGQESEIRYRCDLRIRGNSSRSYPFKPLRIAIPGDDDLGGLTGFNLNPKAPHLQHLGLRLFQAAGLRAPDSIPVEVRRNGVHYTTSSGSTPDYGLFVRVEDVGGEFVDNHWTLEGENDGQAYNKRRPDQFWRSTQPAPANPDLALDGWSKQNARAANDWSDLRQFFQVWQNAAAPHFPGATPGNVAESGGNTTSTIGRWAGTAFTSAQMESLATVSDFTQWARWFAVMTILQDNETNISNGEDDDYAAYLRPVVVGGVTNRLLELLPHDLDTIFGLGDSTLAFNARGLYDMTDDTRIFRTLLPLFGTSTVPGNPEFRALYHAELRALLGSIFDTTTERAPTPPFHQWVDYHLGDWAPASVRTSIKNFTHSRRTYLLGLLNASAEPPPAGTAEATFASPAGALRLHEILAVNATSHLHGGGFPDVVELLNTGTQTLDLSGLRLSDDPTQPNRFIFPPGLTLAPGGILVLYADSDFGAPGLHLGFSLSSAGETLTLRDREDLGGAVLDSLTFGAQIADFSLGRVGPALDTWALCLPSIGATNQAVEILADPHGVRINEWLGNADYRAEDDFVELHNPALHPVALGGMGLSDDPVNRPFRHRFPPLSFLAPSGFLALWAKGDSASPDEATELPFNISSSTGSLALFGVNTARVDFAQTLPQFRDVSTGRVPDGSGAFARLSPPSPGFSNQPLADGDLDLLNHLRITEIHYHPPGADSEFIELRNTSDRSPTPVTLELGGVNFTRGITYTFAPGVTLAPGEALVLVHDPVRYAQQFPDRPTAGVYSGRLADGGERLTLELPGTALPVHDFTYDDAWHPLTDGGGYALQILDPFATLEAWNRGSGWTAAPLTPTEDPPFALDAGAETSWPVGVRLPLAGRIVPGPYAPDALGTLWQQVSGPAPAVITTPDLAAANATFPLPGLYELRLDVQTPDPATFSALRTVRVFDTYATWAERLLTGFPPGLRGWFDDADGDGAPNLLEFALGTGPHQVGSAPRLHPVAHSLFRVGWSRSRLADPSLTVAAQIADRPEGPWSEHPGQIHSLPVNADTTHEHWEATDQSGSPPGPPRLFRLRVTAP